MQKPEMHCHKELIKDINYPELIPDHIMTKWFNEYYSISKHVFTLYSIARGLNAKNILEIGFGRSSFVLARAAYENKGQFITCDNRDFSYLLNEKEKTVTSFVHGHSNQVWNMSFPEGIDFAFLDYFSSESTPASFIIEEIKLCLSKMKQNGIVAIHDSVDNRFNVSKALKKLKYKNFFLPRKHLEIASLPYNYGLGIIRTTEKSKFGRIQDGWLKR